MSTDRLYQLAAKADEQLRQFRSTDEEDQGTSTPRMIARGVGAAGVGAAGALAYQNRDKLKAGANVAVNTARFKIQDAGSAAADAAGKVKSSAKKVATKATDIGKDIGWHTTRKTADGLNSAGNFVGRMGKKVAGKSATVDSAVGGLKGALKKGAKTLKKGSMKFWNRGTCDRIVDLAARIENLRVL
jgi:hypothetical protein